MSDKVLIDRDLLAKATMLPSMRSLEENRRDIVERGRAQADIREMLAAAPAAPEQVEHERELFEQYMKQRAPGANLQQIGDKYGDTDVQWHFETWLARADLSGKGGAQ